jgi:hypothetical protein
LAAPLTRMAAIPTLIWLTATNCGDGYNALEDDGADRTA